MERYDFFSWLKDNAYQILVSHHNRQIDEKDRDIAGLKEQIKLLNPCGHTGFESVSCEVCGYPDSRKLIAELKALPRYCKTCHARLVAITDYRAMLKEEVEE
jgi:hypothetical protein